MAFNLRPYDTQSHYNHLLLPSSSSHHTIPVKPVITRDAVRRELEKEIIREQILAGEIDRRRREILEAEVRRELMTSVPRTGGVGFTSPALGLGLSLHTRRYEYEPLLLIDSRTSGMQLQERCDVSRCYRREIGGVEAVPLQRRLPSPKNSGKKDMIGLGHPSGSKRKVPSPRARPNKEDFRCADCNIKAPSAKGLEQHLLGKKHLAMKGKKIMKRPKRKHKKGKKH